MFYKDYNLLIYFKTILLRIKVDNFNDKLYKDNTISFSNILLSNKNKKDDIKELNIKILSF